ncbi:hypothetical protein JOM56_014662 [Amanita muscaria]
MSLLHVAKSDIEAVASYFSVSLVSGSLELAETEGRSGEVGSAFQGEVISKNKELADQKEHEKVLEAARAEQASVLLMVKERVGEYKKVAEKAQEEQWKALLMS